jgi:hypothetical protein
MRILPNGKPFILPNGKPSHAEGCCCSFCCVRDPWPTLYLTLDNFEIDLPLTPALVGTGECNFFCTESELNDLAAAHFTALPSTGDLTWSVLNEAGPDVPATPSGTWDTCHKLAFGPECLLYTDGKYRYVLNNGYGSPDVSDPCNKFPAAGVLDQDMQCGGPGLPIRRCFFYPIYNGYPALSTVHTTPNLGLAGPHCNPFYLQAVVEGVFVRWVAYGNNLSGCCYGLGRFRVTITE